MNKRVVTTVGMAAVIGIGIWAMDLNQKQVSKIASNKETASVLQ